MRILPIDDSENDVVLSKLPPPSASKSRLRRLFDRPFKRENDADAVPPPAFEPSSLCLDKMVRNFIEDAGSGSGSNNDKAAKSGKNRCNCFNGNGNDSSDDEDEFDSFFDSVKTSVSDWSDTLKSLVPCATVVERNLLADTSKIVDENGKTCKKKVAESLTAMGYDASVCVSKWEKSSSIPAGDYEYIDVIVNGDRLIVDVDFRSEFEIARSTSSYRLILQSLPSIFVGRSDRLIQIVSIASDAARHSLKKKGMHVAPWRKAEYMKSKWLGPHTRKPSAPSSPSRIDGNFQNVVVGKEDSNCASPGRKDAVEVLESEVGELDLIFGEDEEKTPSLAIDVVTWQLPAVRCRGLERVAVPTGLASLFKEKKSVF